MKKLLLGFSILSTLALVSCRESENVVTKYSENDIPNIVKVKENSTFAPNTTARHEITIGWDEWGRKSKDCGGWGLCNFSFHYDQTGKSSNKSKYISNIVSGLDGRKFFYVLLSERPNPEIPKNVLALRIDENITYSYNNTNYIVKAGVYYYDNDLGDFGGYAIKVD